MTISNNFTLPEDQNVDFSQPQQTLTSSSSAIPCPCLTPINTTVPVFSNNEGNLNIGSASPTGMFVSNGSLQNTAESIALQQPTVNDLGNTNPTSDGGTVFDQYGLFDPNTEDGGVNIDGNFGPGSSGQPSVNDSLCGNPLWALLTLPCPTCNGGKKKAIRNKAGKKYINLAAKFSKWPTPIYSVISGIQDELNGLINVAAVNTQFTGGKCPTCKGKNTVPDPSAKANEATKKGVDYLDAHKQQIQDLEARAGGKGGCGNRYTIVATNDVLQVGLGVNKTASYKVDNTGTAPSALDTGAPTTTVFRKDAKYVSGNNLPAPGCGHYVIQCYNKFTCFTGAHGIELVTHGPVNIAGGMTKITGAEVSVGSGVGPVTIAGDHLQLNGKSVAVNVSGPDSHFHVQGTMSATGNMVIGGGAHVDGDLSFTSATAPSKEVRTEFSSQIDNNSFKAVWGGLSVKAISDQISNLQRFTKWAAGDPSLIIASKAGIQAVSDHMKHLAYLSQPYESSPTGWILPGQCIVVGAYGTSTNTTLIPVYIQPHHHNIPDMKHVHQMTVPNINLMDRADDVRKNASSKSFPMPAAAATSTNHSIILQSITSAITTAAKLPS
jgi:hypothetical protein